MKSLPQDCDDFCSPECKESYFQLGLRERIDCEDRLLLKRKQLAVATVEETLVVKHRPEWDNWEFVKEQ